MAGPHQPSGLPDADLPHQKYMYVCMYVCMYALALDTYTPIPANVVLPKSILQHLFLFLDNTPLPESLAVYLEIKHWLVAF